ncbi:unnamed protein product, partial [Adineta ricciae]
SSSATNKKQLREYCQSHLPPHMIPSLFIFLDKLPLNANGKIDRKLLPSPDLSDFSSADVDVDVEYKLPRNEIESTVHEIWCETFQRKQISIDTNLFDIGGHSLILMQLIYRYKRRLHLDTNYLCIVDLFQHPTIVEHAQLIRVVTKNTSDIDSCSWFSLYLDEARVSFSQERVFLDEHISLRDNHIMYAMPSLYRLASVNTNDFLSITRLHDALRRVIIKHSSLRTALYHDADGNIIQRSIDVRTNDAQWDTYKFSVRDVPHDDQQTNEVISEILNQSDLFDLSKGHVINCHVLRRHRPQNRIPNYDDDILKNDDLILFSVHHAFFDGASTLLFIRELSLAYENTTLSSTDENKLTYIDYSVHERLLDMTVSRNFWRSQLEGYNLEQRLSLPVDRHRTSVDERSGLACTAEIVFDDEMLISFLDYASVHHLTLFQLGLSLFYVFLFKLTHGQTDLCISSLNANRYRSELENMIGMFVSTLPFRVQLDGAWLFDEVLQYVKEKSLSIYEHSFYPLQTIVTDFHLNLSNIGFLETMFEFVSVAASDQRFSFGGVTFQELVVEPSYEVVKFDFSASFVYNPLWTEKKLSCSLLSSNIFDRASINKIAQRFKHFIRQLLVRSSIMRETSSPNKSIDELCLMLPEEIAELQETIFTYSGKITKEGKYTYSYGNLLLSFVTGSSI